VLPTAILKNSHPTHQQPIDPDRNTTRPIQWSITDLLFYQILHVNLDTLISDRLVADVLLLNVLSLVLERNAEVQPVTDSSARVEPVGTNDIHTALDISKAKAVGV
jgi:hypothetical protein